MFHWNEGRSFFWQVTGLVAFWAYIVALHWHNDGLWYQGDAPRHAANGLFWWDLLRSVPADPRQFALSYFARYPVITPTSYPPVFYLLAGGLQQLFGNSPFVAKGLVLAFLLFGCVYSILWCRRAAGPLGGWIGLLLVAQPVVIKWSHAVMLNVPSTALAVASLYHWRRSLDSPETRHFWLAVIFAALAVLTYPSVGIILFVMIGSVCVAGAWRSFFRARTLVAVLLGAAVIVPWVVVSVKWAPGHMNVWFTLGDYGLWELAGWTHYLRRLPHLVSTPVLICATLGLITGLRQKAWRQEAGTATVWFGTCYAWFSAISMKQDRFVILLVPPLVILAAIGLVGTIQWVAEKRERSAVRPTLFLALATIAVQVVLVFNFRVPHAEGFRSMVETVSEITPGKRFFYEGYYDGTFSYYVRASDDRFERGVSIGSKLLYSTRLTREYGIVEHANSAEEIATLLREQCGCELLLLERDSLLHENFPLIEQLREALRGPEFRLVRTFEVNAPRVRYIDLYEYRTPPTSPDAVRLHFPLLGQDTGFSVQPIER